MATANRGAFSNRLGFILAAAGSAVGLGNIWRFPFEVGLGGGAAFVVMYLIFCFLLCFSQIKKKKKKKLFLVHKINLINLSTNLNVGQQQVENLKQSEHCY